jgi:hypothetical protein
MTIIDFANLASITIEQSIDLEKFPSPIQPCDIYSIPTFSLIWSDLIFPVLSVLLSDPRFKEVQPPILDRRNVMRPKTISQHAFSGYGYYIPESKSFSSFIFAEYDDLHTFSLLSDVDSILPRSIPAGKRPPFREPDSDLDDSLSEGEYDYVCPFAPPPEPLNCALSKEMLIPDIWARVRYMYFKLCDVSFEEDYYSPTSPTYCPTSPSYETALPKGVPDELVDPMGEYPFYEFRHYSIIVQDWKSYIGHYTKMELYEFWLLGQLCEYPPVEGSEAFPIELKDEPMEVEDPVSEDDSVDFLPRHTATSRIDDFKAKMQRNIDAHDQLRGKKRTVVYDTDEEDEIEETPKKRVKISIIDLTIYPQPPIVFDQIRLDEPDAMELATLLFLFMAVHWVDIYTTLVPVSPLKLRYRKDPITKKRKAIVSSTEIETSKKRFKNK